MIPNSHPFRYGCFFLAFTQLQKQSVIYGGEFFKPESMYAIMAWGFPIQYFLEFSSQRILGIHFSCYLLSQPFCYILSVPIFYSQIVLFPLHPVVGLSLCIFYRHACRIFFRYFRRSCFVCITWPCLRTSQVFLLSPVSFDLFFPVILSDFPVVLF